MDQPQLPRLGRAGYGRRVAPVRIVHVGLGSFTRAHQGWYTDRAPDADRWGIAAFSGHTGGGPGRVVEALRAQDGLYTLVERGPGGDRFAVISSISQALPGSDHDAFRRYVASPDVAVVTSTVTEAGYRRGPDGRLDVADPVVAGDIDLLRGDPGGVPATVPGRLVAGLAARRAAGAGPVTVLPCDNIAGNGAALATVVANLAEAVDPGLAAWIADPGHVDWATSMVDRITPATTGADVETVRRACGYVDGAPVVCEPYAEWVISGAFPAGHPDWEAAGARLVGDVTPFERRKLWLLNGAHTLLAYLGPLYGAATVAQAMAVPACRAAVQDWWGQAARHLDVEVDGYQRALVERFENPRIAHRLSQIGHDGSVKLPQRILPVLAAERAAGRDAGAGALVVAAWICHLRGHAGPVVDPAADRLAGLAAAGDTDAARDVVGFLDPRLAGDTALTGAVADRIAGLEALAT